LDGREIISGLHIGVIKHYDALKIFEKHGIRGHSQALSMLGYKVRWDGLDPDNAEIFNN